MDPAQWAKLSPLLDELLELEGEHRRQRLEQIAREDAATAHALQGMLDADDTRPDFLAEPVFQTATLLPRPGQEFGPYRLMELLGEGGMGQVWLAVRSDGLFERRVALKLLRSGFGDEGLHQRFARERQILARLAHPHIARLLDAGVAGNGQPYLALEFVRGDPITDFADQHGLDLRHRIELFLQVCAAVSHAHANLVVHRDLKPSNILVTALGDVCLLDFGIAKLLDRDGREKQEITRTGARALTLHYAAPEQLRGEDVTTMTDVYALGMVLFELLTGRRAFDPKRDTDAAWEECVLQGEPLQASQAALMRQRSGETPYQARLHKGLRGDIDVILAKALQRAPTDRYASVEALSRDLRRFLDGQPILARPHSFSYRSGKFLRRHAWAIGGAVTVTALLGAALWLTTTQARRASLEAQRSAAMQQFVIGLFDATDTRDGSLQGDDLLNEGEQRAERDLADQPQARAELLGLIAQLRAQLGADEAALRLLDKQDQALQQTVDAPPDIALQGAAVRAHALLRQRQPARCVERLLPLMPTAEAAGAAFSASRASYYAALARCQMELSRHAEAQGLLDRALSLRQSGDDGAALAMTQTDIAFLRLAEGQPRQALTQIQDALSTLRRAVGERNREGVEIWHATGLIYAALDDPLESSAAYRQAINIAQERLASTHPLALQLQRELAQVLMRGHEYRAAQREFEQWVQRTGSAYAADDPLLLRVRLQQAQTLLALDAHAEAEAGFMMVVDGLGKSPRDPMLAEAWCGMAAARLRAARWQDARQAAERCREFSIGEAAGRAQLLLAQAERGMGLLPEAMRRWQGLGATRWWPQAELELLAAEDIVELKDFTTRADTLRRRLLSEKGHEPLLWQLQALIADHECEGGGLEAGQSRMEDTLQEINRKRPDDLALLAQVLGRAPSCRERAVPSTL